MYLSETINSAAQLIQSVFVTLDYGCKASITITVCSTTPLTAQTNAKPEAVEDPAGRNPA